MGSYNILREHVEGYQIPSNPFMTFCFGATAGTITVYATQPFDVVKTRSPSVHGAAFSDAVRSVWNECGAKGFWKGSTMRLGRLLLSGGIVFSVYEQMAGILMDIQR
jgi:solute carrier family 25 (mitochondrial citrate transporter), member 1